jgi:phosphomannomutase
VTVARTSTVDGFRYDLEDDAWVLIRFSGTEPLMRIYAEASSLEQVQRLIGAGRALTGV